MAAHITLREKVVLDKNLYLHLKHLCNYGIQLNWTTHWGYKMTFNLSYSYLNWNKEVCWHGVAVELNISMSRSPEAQTASSWIELKAYIDNWCILIMKQFITDIMVYVSRVANRLFQNNWIFSISILVPKPLFILFPIFPPKDLKFIVFPRVCNKFWQVMTEISLGKEETQNRGQILTQPWKL